jgi:hypothetical protein
MTDITSTDNPATAQLNRRAALLGAAAASVAMVTPTVAAPLPSLKPVDEVRAPGPLEAEVAMMDAARQFSVFCNSRWGYWWGETNMHST